MHCGPRRLAWGLRGKPGGGLRPPGLHVKKCPAAQASSTNDCLADVRRVDQSDWDGVCWCCCMAVCLIIITRLCPASLRCAQRRRCEFITINSSPFSLFVWSHASSQLATVLLCLPLSVCLSICLLTTIISVDLLRSAQLVHTASGSVPRWLRTCQLDVRAKAVELNLNDITACFGLLPRRRCHNKKLSCRRETALCFVSPNILLSHSRLLDVIRNGTLEYGVCT